MSYPCFLFLVGPTVDDTEVAAAPAAEPSAVAGDDAAAAEPAAVATNGRGKARGRGRGRGRRGARGRGK